MVRARVGAPVDLPYPVHVECLNGALRDRLDGLAHKTHRFAKDVASWDALFHLALREQSWRCPERARRAAFPEEFLPFLTRQCDFRSLPHD